MEKSFREMSYILKGEKSAERLFTALTSDIQKFLTLVSRLVSKVQIITKHVTNNFLLKGKETDVSNHTSSGTSNLALSCDGCTILQGWSPAVATTFEKPFLK